MNFINNSILEVYSEVFQGNKKVNVQSFYLRGSLNKFPDFFRMGTFIDGTHMKL